MLKSYSYQITNVSVEDIKDVYKLLSANRPYVGLNSRYTYFLLAKDFSDTCLVAKVDSKVAAFSSGYIPPKRPDTFFNWEIVVDQGYRGKGLQKALLLHQIKKSNVKFLELTINPSNDICRKNIIDLAQSLSADWTECVLFSEQDFDYDGHESEVLFRIGPISMETAKV
jgi:L-2,4-diaminobutyric acid acetyltransferase